MVTKIIVSVRSAQRPGPSSPPSNKIVLNPSPDASPLAASGSSVPDDTKTSLMTPDRSFARATDHTAGNANKITPKTPSVDANRRGEPSLRERMTSTTEINRVTTKRTAITCNARRKFSSSTNDVISLRRTKATTTVATGIIKPSNSKKPDNTPFRKKDGEPGAINAPSTAPDGPRFCVSSSLGVEVAVSMSAKRFNAL